MSRRRWLRLALYGLPPLAVADGFLLEPKWAKVKKIRLVKGQPVCRLVHFSDLHHKGAIGYLRRVVRRINSLSPDFVCFTGDIVEEANFLPEALEALKSIKAPLYGVPGNHDHWSGADFGEIARAFAATGGEWLVDRQVTTLDGRVHLTGIDQVPTDLSVKAASKHILLMHYPGWVTRLGSNRFDLVLAGHSHGGQVRLPFIGALVVPFGVGKYDLGLFETPAGPLHVTSGIGNFYAPVRFYCRPEITVLEI